MEENSYNFLSKLLHKISLGSKSVSEMSFEIEKVLYLKKTKHNVAENHLFISGLARSGTTAFLNLLHETNQFSSLTYEDMPFILAPNFGGKFSKRKTGEALKKKERSHKDGILINNESPEALDEVFWKVFLDDTYIQKDRLVTHEIGLENKTRYSQYIDLIVLKHSEKAGNRYLSKNNNSILRLSSLLQNFPNATVVIPFRNPLQHALSLLNQHQHFCKLQTENPFTLKYMNWVGHHEFGLNQKPFYLGNDSVFTQLLETSKEDINYWLLTWLNYYTYVSEHFMDSCVLFSYEKFCEEPTNYIQEISKKIGLQDIQFELKSFLSKERKCDGIDEDLLRKCAEIHEKLNHHC